MSKIVFAARVEDGDDPPWTQLSARTGESILLLAYRFYRRELQIPKPRNNAWVLKSTSGTGQKSQELLRRNQMYLDIFRYIYVFRAGISSFIQLIEWSFRMITHPLSGDGKGMKGYNALDCAIISRGSAGATSSAFCRKQRGGFKP